MEGGMVGAWTKLRQFWALIIASSLVYWVVAAAVGLLISTLLADTARDHDHLIFAGTIVNKAARTSEFVEVKSPPWYRDRVIYGEIIRELSFAFLIAAFVGAVIELRSRKRTEEEISNYTQDIARDVFLSTMRLSVSENVWDELKELIMKMKLIREDLKATYELLELSDVPELSLSPEAIERLSPDNVAFKWNSEFWLSNKSDIQVDHVLTYTYPIRRELEDWSKLSIIHQISVGDEVRLWSDIKDEKSLEMDEGERVFKWPISIPAKERVQISSTVYMVKSRGGNETWATMLPTSNFHLTFINSLRNNLEIGVQSNFPGSMKEGQQSQSGRVRQWDATRPLLPYQSVVVWWRNP